MTNARTLDAMLAEIIFFLSYPLKHDLGIRIRIVLI